MAERIRLRTHAREEMIDITDVVAHVIRQSGVRDGIACLWSLHTTCGLTVNEGHDPDVVTDMVGFFRRLVPQDPRFAHAEGNSDSHIKTTLFGPGLTLIVENSQLLLGTWQRIFLAEWDGPRERTLALTTIPRP
jgi:secondary thiamine-phosphate synthase enzyme